MPTLLPGTRPPRLGKRGKIAALSLLFMSLLGFFVICSLHVQATRHSTAFLKLTEVISLPTASTLALAVTRTINGTYNAPTVNDTYNAPTVNRTVSPWTIQTLRNGTSNSSNILIKPNASTATNQSNTPLASDLPILPLTWPCRPVGIYSRDAINKLCTSAVQRRTCSFPTGPDDIVIGIWHSAYTEHRLTWILDSWHREDRVVFLAMKGAAQSSCVPVLETAAQGDDFISTLQKGLYGLRAMFDR